MTFCFIQAVERGHAQTYGSLLNAMRDAIRSTNVNSGMGSGPVTGLLEMLVMGGSLTGGLTQVWALQPLPTRYCLNLNWSFNSLFRSERCEINSLLGSTLINISFDKSSYVVGSLVRRCPLCLVDRKPSGFVCIGKLFSRNWSLTRTYGNGHCAGATIVFSYNVRHQPPFLPLKFFIKLWLQEAQIEV